MRILVVGLMLFSMHPMPRQATRDAAGGSANINQNPNRDNNAPARPLVQTQPSTPANQGQSGNPASESEPRRVVIVSGPSKDIWDKVYICLTAALVFIGAGTLGAIWYQAIQNRKSADAALLNAQAVINSERAYLDGKILSQNVVGVTMYRIKITNAGKTPARLLEYKVRVGYLIPGTAFSADSLGKVLTVHPNRLIAANSPYYLGGSFRLDQKFGEPLDIHGDNPQGAIFITAAYEDIIAAEGLRGHVLEFGYLYKPLLDRIERVFAWDHRT